MATADVLQSGVTAEDGAGWLAFLRSLIACGLHGVQLVIPDAHAGLVDAIGAVLPGVSRQRCRMRHARHLLSQVPEAALTILTIEHRRVPPIANLQAPAPEFDIDCVTKQPRRQGVRTEVSHSFGFGGHNVVLAFTAA